VKVPLVVLTVSWGSDGGLLVEGKAEEVVVRERTVTRRRDRIFVVVAPWRVENRIVGLRVGI